MAKKEYTVEQIKNGKAHDMPVAQQYEAIKKSMKKDPDPIAFTDDFEEKLRERLFMDEIEEIQKQEKEKEENPDFERAGYVAKVEKKPGL